MACYLTLQNLTAMSAALQVAEPCSASSYLTCLGLPCRALPSLFPDVSRPWLL